VFICVHLWLLFLFAVLPVAFAAQKTGEVKRHGLDFEQWLSVEFFGGYEAPSYTAKWDIAASANRKLSKPYRGLPVSVKCAKIGRPVDLGDVLRQRSINEPFIVIVGLWNQRTPTEKWIEEIVCLRIEPAAWERLWGSLAYDDLAALDTAVKDRKRSVAEVRAHAAQWKRDRRDAGNTITIHYKIDERGQRRIQCSIPIDALLAAASKAERGKTLFERAFPNPILSSPRSFLATPR